MNLPEAIFPFDSKHKHAAFWHSELKVPGPKVISLGNILVMLWMDEQGKWFLRGRLRIYRDNVMDHTSKDDKRTFEHEMENYTGLDDRADALLFAQALVSGFADEQPPEITVSMRLFTISEPYGTKEVLAAMEDSGQFSVTKVPVEGAEK